MYIINNAVVARHCFQSVYPALTHSIIIHSVFLLVRVES